ncbi:MAG TPA: type IV secretion system protein [Streptosporangiaceae bacterium]
MLRSRRLLRRTALVVAMLAVLLGLPHGGGQSGPAASPGVAAASAVPAAPAAATTGQAAGSAREPAAVQTMAMTGSATSSGLCSVPGIGDIGGLIGFCSLGQAGLTGDLNSLCEPSTPTPEPASAGIDALVEPPAATSPAISTPYSQYGVAGTYWAATDLQCSDMTSLIGNSVGGMLFDIAKSIDRVTITIYQAAAGEGILSWLRSAADRLITSLGNAIYFPYVAVIVILGAIWLAWQALIRKRATRSVEGTIWMVAACAAAIWLIGRPADFTGLGKGVSDGISTTLNAAFAKLPSPGQGGCMPVQKADPQIQPSSFSYTAGNTVVDQNANNLWTVLVCKPWLAGELGTTSFAPPGARPTAVNIYARQLLWSQAIAANEKPTPALIKAKQATYTGIAQSIRLRDPGAYPLFQGKQWTTRLEIGFAALLAALLAGLLVLLISVTLILLKLGFLLLLIVGPFFLLIGTHPGFGRVIALRWLELLVGVLLKQAAVALVLSVLLYSYALIMGTSDAVLPWALKILMIALVTVAAVIYRRPFQHLFSSVGYGVLGAGERAETDLRRASATLRENTLAAATAVPGVAGYRAARWARRNPAQAAGLAMAAATASGAAAAAGTAASGVNAPEGSAESDAAASPAAAPDRATASGRAGLGSRARALSGVASDGAGREAPPLRLPSRQQATSSGSGGRSGGAVAGGGVAASTGPGSAAPGRAPAGGSRLPAGRPVPARPQPARSRASAPTGRGEAGGAARPASPAGGSSSAGPPGDQGRGGAGRGGAGRGGGPWQGSARREAPARQASPGRRPAPARQPARARSRGAAGGPGSGRGSAAPSRPWFAPRSSSPAGGDPAAGDGDPGTQAADQAAAPGPFWLRPVRRRK